MPSVAKYQVSVRLKSPDSRTFRVTLPPETKHEEIPEVAAGILQASHKNRKVVVDYITLPDGSRWATQPVPKRTDPKQSERSSDAGKTTTTTSGTSTTAPQGGGDDQQPNASAPNDPPKDDGKPTK